MRIRRFSLITILLFATLIFSGCIGGGAKIQTWAVMVNSYHFKDLIRAGSVTYRPDSGYEYLVVNVSVTNVTQEPQDLALIFVGNGFDFISMEGNTYADSFFLSSPSDHLPEYYKAQQTLTGNVYIEIPVNTDVSKGQLIFKAIDNPKAIIIDLSSVPEEKI